MLYDWRKVKKNITLPLEIMKISKAEQEKRVDNLLELVGLSKFKDKFPWQISGRSDILDFDEVVRLDTKYINEWSFGLDIKILLKTVLVVLKHEGSM